MPGRERPSVRVLGAGSLLGFVALLLGGQLPAAYAAHPVADPASIKSYEGTVRVNADGTLRVHETVTYDFGGTPTASVQRAITTREQYDATDDRLYDVSDLTADADPVEVDTSVDSGDTSDTMTVSFMEPQSGEITVTYDYQVDGTVALAIGRSNPWTTGHLTSSPSGVSATVPSTW